MAADIKQAMRDLRPILAESPDDEVAANEITMLAQVMRRIEPLSTQALAIYVEDLAGIPPSIIRTACRRIRRKDVWMPGIADLLAACNAVRAEVDQQVRKLVILAGVAELVRVTGEDMLDAGDWWSMEATRMAWGYGVRVWEGVAGPEALRLT